MDGSRSTVIAARDVDVVVFDMDGVVTQTAKVHAAAWKELFDAYLRERAQRLGEPFREFDLRADYLPYVDGKPRYDGVRDFLASRGIELPAGTPSDPPGAETVRGLGDRKNGYFLEAVARFGVQPYETTVALIGRLHEARIRTAIISASVNTTMILEAAGVRDLFEAQVDGSVAERLGLPGKPDPAVFIEAARRLGAAPPRSAVVEDAVAGVQAGRSGGFALVVGVDRGGNREALGRFADVVVDDLAELSVLPA
jgi:beta-phosphoglucomutase family hydrolase